MQEWQRRTCVIILVLCSTAGATDPWADEVVDASRSLDGSGLYNDPRSVLGMPTRRFYDPFQQAQFSASLALGVFNRATPDGDKLITTLNRRDFIKVRFNEVVEDDPDNLYGIDLLVFGNSFFTSNTFIRPGTDMETVALLGIFKERVPVTVAVSQSGRGSPKSHPDDWYVYDEGPFADDLFPTNAFVWDRCTHAWGVPLNFTKPVDPKLTIDDFRGVAADAIDLYGNSGGGTGFDLAESGFDWIQYVYLTSRGGEVDALVDVTPGRIPPGDIDIDGDVDAMDFAMFQTCYSGSDAGPVECQCKRADLDEDTDVDLDDLALWLEQQTGPK